jgi:hypothetical protein
VIGDTLKNQGTHRSLTFSSSVKTKVEDLSKHPYVLNTTEAG